jgi:hypothetical protein
MPPKKQVQKIVADKKVCAKYKLTVVLTKMPTKTIKEKTVRKPSVRNQVIGKMLKAGGSANITSNPKLNMSIANQMYKDKKLLIHH